LYGHRPGRAEVSAGQCRPPQRHRVPSERGRHSHRQPRDRIFITESGTGMAETGVCPAADAARIHAARRHDGLSGCGEFPRVVHTEPQSHPGSWLHRLGATVSPDSTNWEPQSPPGSWLHRLHIMLPWQHDPPRPQSCSRGTAAAAAALPARVRRHQLTPDRPTPGLQDATPSHCWRGHRPLSRRTARHSDITGRPGRAQPPPTSRRLARPGSDSSQARQPRI